MDSRVDMTIVSIITVSMLFKHGVMDVEDLTD